MARVITDELHTCAFAILTGERQVHREGMPIFNGTGEPKMEPMWILQFTHEEGGTLHVVRVPFDRDGKDKLIAALTGGIVPASALPDGVDLRGI